MAVITEAKKILDLFGKDLITDLTKSLSNKGHGASASGVGGSTKLAGTMSFTVFGQETSLIFELEMADYWEYINDGTRKANSKGSGGKELAKKLDDWARGKGIYGLAIYKSKLKNPSKSKRTFNKAQRSLAWAIKKNIHKKGIIKRFNYKGSHWFDDVVNDGRLETLSEQLSEVLAREVTVELVRL